MEVFVVEEAGLMVCDVYQIKFKDCIKQIFCLEI